VTIITNTSLSAGLDITFRMCYNACVLMRTTTPHPHYDIHHNTCLSLGTSMRLLTTAALLAFTALSPANATLIASFGQNPSETPTIVATDDGTTTHIGATNASTSITTFFGGGTIPNALFNLAATSVDAAQTLGTLVFQHYSGTFCFTSATGCGGTNYLSGVFTDAAFGALGGPGLTLNVNNPPDTLTLTSSVVPAADLGAPSTFGLTFADLTPVLAVHGTTIQGFTADYSGTVSSNTNEVVEPASFAILGAGLVGVGLFRRRSHRIGDATA
jgi:hypothetical protein